MQKDVCSCVNVAHGKFLVVINFYIDLMNVLHFNHVPYLFKYSALNATASFPSGSRGHNFDLSLQMQSLLCATGVMTDAVQRYFDNRKQKFPFV
jgi:hypothetical protein